MAGFRITYLGRWSTAVGCIYTQLCRVTGISDFTLAPCSLVGMATAGKTRPTITDCRFEYPHHAYATGTLFAHSIYLYAPEEFEKQPV